MEEITSYTQEERECILETAKRYRGNSKKSSTFKEYLAREVSYIMNKSYDVKNLYKEYRGLLKYGNQAPYASSYDEYYYNTYGTYPQPENTPEEVLNHKELKNAYLESIHKIEKDAEKEHIAYVFLTFTCDIEGLENNLKLKKIGKNGLYVGYFHDNYHMSSTLSHIEDDDYENYLVIPYL